MSHFFHHLRTRPHLATSLLVGTAAAVLLPDSLTLVSRALLGWNIVVWLYLLLVGWMMLHADHTRLRSVALAEAEGAATVLAVVCVASVVSLLGIVAELSAAKIPGARHAVPHVAFALATVAGSWLLLPTIFALTYASAFYITAHGSGLEFPGAADGFKPDYGDFLYFAFTIAATAQTSDVSVSTSAMRRLVLLQSLLSFMFNTAILALTINIAASLF
jgi:uncharacterized membrane protein